MADEGNPDGRFQPGRSGNPKGRPRKANTVTGVIRKALDAKVTMTEGGRRKRISKLQAGATQWANKAASGDLRAGKLAFDLAIKEEQQTSAANGTESISESDLEIVERLRVRLRLIDEAQGRTDADAN